jgi:type II secretory pathway pseudopilin PulG
LTTKSHPGTTSLGNKAGLAAALCCIPLLGFIGYRLVVPSAEQEQSRQVRQALAACQQAIRAQARYGGADAPPYTSNHGTGDEFYFAWPTGSFAFTNGFGAPEKMSASCIGDLRTGTITQLTLNGQTIR